MIFMLQMGELSPERLSGLNLTLGYYMEMWELTLHSLTPKFKFHQ